MKRRVIEEEIYTTLAVLLALTALTSETSGIPGNCSDKLRLQKYLSKARGTILQSSDLCKPRININGSTLLMEKDSGIFIRDGGAINVLCPNETKCLELESEAMIRCWYRVRNPEKFCGINLYGQGLLLSSSAMLYMGAANLSVNSFTHRAYFSRNSLISMSDESNLKIYGQFMATYHETHAPRLFLSYKAEFVARGRVMISGVLTLEREAHLETGSKAQLSTYPGSSLFLHEYTQLLIGLSSPYEEEWFICRSPLAKANEELLADRKGLEASLSAKFPINRMSFNLTGKIIRDKFTTLDLKFHKTVKLHGSIKVIGQHWSLLLCRIEFLETVILGYGSIFTIDLSRLIYEHVVVKSKIDLSRDVAKRLDEFLTD